MKQHPIPQNILDIEFKLFTKFTVREFVYMAIGIGFGGIFLYFFTRGELPGIIAIPVFVVSSAIGLFLGLVPINDQKADIFLKNYIWAITNPTQRVWKNEKLLDKNQITDKMEMTQGTMQRNPNEAGSAKIVGADPVKQNQFIEGSKLTELDKEEEMRLEAIGKEAGATLGSTPTPSPLQPQATSPVESEPVKQESADQPVLQQYTPAPGAILISRETLKNFQTETGNENLFIGFKIINRESVAKAGSIVALKRSNGSVIFAQRADQEGLVTMMKPLEPGIYKLLVQDNDKTYGNIEIALDGKPFPIIKLILG